MPIYQGFLDMNIISMRMNSPTYDVHLKAIKIYEVYT